MDQGRQRRDQMDAAVVQNVRGQRRAAPTSCARLQSRQFLSDAGDARADQGLVTDKLEGEADQDRRESREPRPLCRLPNGGGRHPTTNVPGDSAADRGTTAAATTRASMKRFDCHAFKRNRQEECVQMPVKIARSAPSTIVRAARAAEPSTPRVSLAARPEKREYSRQFGRHPGNPGSTLSLSVK